MIPKIDQDIESTRHQRNMTKTQKRNDSNVKEGVIVNSFVKDPLLSLDETCDTLIISNTNIDLPQKVYEKETKQRTINPSVYCYSRCDGSIRRFYSYDEKVF